ncbi:MAG TPA: pitrilysin family protein [Pyrinomonadaceae bacterium]|nr:pitrilysin family protein [Pyrinomonadaceae bacterium]
MNTSVFLTFLRLSALALLLSGASLTAPAQVSEPQRAQLLNGLRVVQLHKPGDQNVLIKLRIHSGAAFDLAGKEGTAALLGDILFPDPNVREYFTEEMGGRLTIKTDYDAITITMQGRAGEFERMVEILRTALVTTQLTPENVTRIRNGRIKVIKETSISPALVADRAIAARLFGDFPYGRPSGGTPESLERVDRADLMLARERFLNPNNSTLTIIGGVPPARSMRALRQLLGIWRKSDQVVPSTFRQPVKPDARTLIVNAPGDQSVEIRFAVRGLAKRDPDALAVDLLAQIARKRWEASLPELSRTPIFTRHDAYSLPGIFVMGTTVDHLLAGKTLTAAQNIARELTRNPVSMAELDQAKADLLATLNKEFSDPEGQAHSWLDMDTYGIASADRIRLLNSVTVADLQRTAGRLFSDAAFASVVVGNSELVKTQLETVGKVEVVGSIEPKTETNIDPLKPKTPTGSKPE